MGIRLLDLINNHPPAIPGFKNALRVRQRNFHPVNQLGSFIWCLHVLGCEFRLRRHKGDNAII